MLGALPQIWLRLISDPVFAARLRSDFAGTLRSEGFADALPIRELPAVYQWHRALQNGIAADRIVPPAGMRRCDAAPALGPTPD